MHTQRCHKPGQRVLIVDDLLATGGTLGCDKTSSRSGRYCCRPCFLIELVDLKGRDLLKEYQIKTLIKY